MPDSRFDRLKSRTVRKITSFDWLMRSMCFAICVAFSSLYDLGAGYTIPGRLSHRARCHQKMSLLGQLMHTGTSSLLLLLFSFFSLDFNKNSFFLSFLILSYEEKMDWLQCATEFPRTQASLLRSAESFPVTQLIFRSLSKLNIALWVW